MNNSTYNISLATSFDSEIDINVNREITGEVWVVLSNKNTNTDNKQQPIEIGFEFEAEYDYDIELPCGETGNEEYIGVGDFRIESFKPTTALLLDSNDEVSVPELSEADFDKVKEVITGEIIKALDKHEFTDKEIKECFSDY